MENGNFNSSNGNYEFPPAPPGQSTTLKVFGILTFVGCGFALLGQLAALGQEELPLPELRQASWELPLMLALLVTKIFGVILMFQNRRNGFYMYTAAELLSYYGVVIFWDRTVLALEYMQEMQGGVVMDPVTMAVVSLVISLALSITWIAVYAGQAKNMEPG